MKIKRNVSGGQIESKRRVWKRKRWKDNVADRATVER